MVNWEALILLAKGILAEVFLRLMVGIPQAEAVEQVHLAEALLIRHQTVVTGAQGQNGLQGQVHIMLAVAVAVYILEVPVVLGELVVEVALPQGQLAT
jgi:hypothetical protein